MHVDDIKALVGKIQLLGRVKLIIGDGIQPFFESLAHGVVNKLERRIDAEHMNMRIRSRQAARPLALAAADIQNPLHVLHLNLRGQQMSQRLNHIRAAEKDTGNL